MRLQRLWLPTGCLGLALAAYVDEAVTALSQLQGAGSVASAQEGNQERSDENPRKSNIIIQGEVLSFKREGQPKTPDMSL
jgi:hypothetical protein